MKLSKVYQLALKSLPNDLSKIIFCKIMRVGWRYAILAPVYSPWRNSLIVSRACKMNNKITYTLYSFDQNIVHYREVNYILATTREIQIAYYNIDIKVSILKVTNNYIAPKITITDYF